IEVIGCSGREEPCAGAGQPPCMLLYVRRDVDGIWRPLAYDVARREEIALIGRAPEEGFFPSPDGHLVAWPDPPPDEPEQGVRFLDVCTGVLGKFDRGRMAGGDLAELRWRADSRGFAVRLGDPGHLHYQPLVPREDCHPPGLSTRIGAFEIT